MANMATFVALGVVALLYVDGAAGPIASATLWLAAFGLNRLARRLRGATDW